MKSMIINFKFKINLYDTIKFFFFFSFIYFNVIDFFNDSFLIKPYYEMIKLDEYFRICNKNILIEKKIFKKVNDPKISIITPIFNKGITLPRYLKSIQNQPFNDLEIIFIDDFSTDNTLNIINELKKDDERIILIKNKKKKGTLISRNIGALKSKSEFLLFVDPDDLISENILNYTYKLAKRFDYDLIRFNIYMGHFDLNLPEIVTVLKNEPLYKPHVFLNLFYGFGRLLQLDYFITNKLIKKKIFIKAINSINEYFLKQFMIDCEDGLINFMLYKYCDSLYFTRRLGYYYVVTKESITHQSGDFKKRLKSNFLYFKFIFKSTKNNNIEKNIANYIFSEIFSRHKDDIIKLFKNLSSEFNFYVKTINLYLQNDFIPLNSKLILKKLKRIINL